MSTLEYIATIAFLDWCATHPPNWHPPSLPKNAAAADPTKQAQSCLTRPWVAQAINQFYFVLLAGLIVVAVVTHPQAACTVKWGPFMLVPGYRVFVALLPGYTPYRGAWEGVKEGVGKTPLPGAYEKVKDEVGSSTVLQGMVGAQGN